MLCYHSSSHNGIPLGGFAAIGLEKNHGGCYAPRLAVYVDVWSREHTETNNNVHLLSIFISPSLKKIAMKQLARAFQAIVRGLLLVLQFSGSTVAMPVMENARTLADLPETERMDPLQIRRLYLSENRSTPVTADRCRALTTPERAMETAMHPNEMKYFKHVSVAPEPAVGWKSKMLCIAYTYEGDHTTKGIGMISTWMHRCDGAVLLSNKTDTALPSVDVPHIGPER